MNTMASAIQSQRWKRTFLHASVLIPALFGVASLTFAGISGSGIWTQFGLACVALAPIVVVWRATIGSPAITAQARHDLLRKQHYKHLAYLRNLRRKMRRDRDSRTGQLVTKLRTIYEHLERSAEAASADYSGVLPQIHEQARELYESCLKLLEHTFDLWDTGRSLADKANRQSLTRQREAILQEVQQSVEHLDRTLDELRTAVLRRNQPDTGDDAANEQAHLRDELARGIETARAVEQRVNELEQELGLAARNESI